SKMLAYAGLMAGRSRSADVVSGTVGHCFDLDDVSIEQWVLRKVAIAEDQQTRLGQANACLWQDTLLGSSIRDRSGKFILRLGYVVESATREQLADDLELQTRRKAGRPMQLGEDVRLRWTSFVTRDRARERPAVRIQLRR